MENTSLHSQVVFNGVRTKLVDLAHSDFAYCVPFCFDQIIKFVCDLRGTKFECSLLFSVTLRPYNFYLQFHFRFSGSLGKCWGSEVCSKYCNPSLFCLVSVSQVVDLANCLETILAIRIKETLRISLGDP